MTEVGIIQLTEEVNAICKLLGLEPSLVRRLDIRPRTVSAEVYMLRNGKKYTEDGEPVMELHQFEVKA